MGLLCASVLTKASFLTNSFQQSIFAPKYTALLNERRTKPRGDWVGQTVPVRIVRGGQQRKAGS
jgi:hypothetical protein